MRRATCAVIGIYFLAAVSPGAAAETSVNQPSPPAEVIPIGADGVARAEIVVDSYSYKPDRLIVPVGHSVELTLKSVTIIVPHNFVIKAPELGINVSQEVPAGKTVTVQFTPTGAGKTEFYCDKKLLFFESHKEKGMVGTLEVREAPVN
ncbi:MAG TPA: cupredoxin domain-containing protein [Nitrospiria bacterium]|jgi:plastocyanin|nr:cupredoxin domain-containing protein [Nitrospiria bacterium]